MGDANRRPSNLDIMFASEEIVEGVKYVQENDSWGSDHLQLIMQINW